MSAALGRPEQARTEAAGAGLTMSAALGRPEQARTEAAGAGLSVSTGQPMSRGADIRKRLAAGQPVYSLLHGLCSPAAAEMAALAGYDAVIIDEEHGFGDRFLHLGVAQGVAAGGAACLVRIASHAPLAVGQALDLGVDGLIIPGINNAEEARAVVRASRYPPEGTRGYGLAMARASGYGLFPKNYDASVGNGVFIAAIIESVQGVEHAAEIAATAGIDAVVLGLQDLTADMGLPGAFDHPRVVDAVASVERAVQGAGKALGGAVHHGTSLPQLLERGYRFLTLGVDTRLLGAAMRSQLAECPQLQRRVEHR